MVSVGAGCGVDATKPETEVATVNGVVATPDGTSDFHDGGTAEHDVAVDAFDETDKTLDKRGAATVCFSDVAAVVDGGQRLSC